MFVDKCGWFRCIDMPAGSWEILVESVWTKVDILMLCCFRFIWRNILPHAAVHPIAFPITDVIEISGPQWSGGIYLDSFTLSPKQSSVRSVTLSVLREAYIILCNSSESDNNVCCQQFFTPGISCWIYVFINLTWQVNICWTNGSAVCSLYAISIHLHVDHLYPVALSLINS